MRHRVLRVLAAVAVGLTAMTSGCSSPAADAEGTELWVLMSVPNSPVEEYESVALMSQASDLVVVGTIESVAVGREWGDPREPDGANLVASLVITVVVSDVIRGTLPDDREEKVTFEHTIAGYSAAELQKVVVSGGIRDAEGRIAQLPVGSALWYLRARGDQGSEHMTIGEYLPIGGVSYRLVTPQGLVIDKNGAAYTPLAHAHLHLDHAGHPMEVETVEERLASEIAEATFEEVIALSR